MESKIILGISLIIVAKTIGTRCQVQYGIEVSEFSNYSMSFMLEDPTTVEYESQRIMASFIPDICCPRYFNLSESSPYLLAFSIYR